MPQVWRLLIERSHGENKRSITEEGHSWSGHSGQQGNQSLDCQRDLVATSAFDNSIDRASKRI